MTRCSAWYCCAYGCVAVAKIESAGNMETLPAASFAAAEEDVSDDND
jgi:hypothetical protein